MKPRIETIPEKKLIGKYVDMSFSKNRTYELWHSFMPGRKEICNNTGIELYSIEVYPDGFFDNFNPDATFQKWAAIEVTDFTNVPEEMETFILPAGLYAVFLHKGPASEGPKTYQYIFETWLPNSGFNLDNRPHLAIMGEKYENDSAYSKEELWIPVKEKMTSFL